MAGNRITNRKQNTASFLSFLLLFLTSMALVAFATLNLVQEVPKAQEQAVQQEALTEQERRKLVNNLNNQINSILKSLRNPDNETIGTVDGRVGNAIPDLERANGRLGIDSTAHTAIIQHALRSMKKIDSLQSKVIPNLKEEIKDAEDEKDQIEQAFQLYKQSQNFNNN